LRSGIIGAFVARYSGATARDLHPFPYSPPAMTGDTFSRNHTRCCGKFQRTTQLIAVSSCIVKSEREEFPQVGHGEERFKKKSV
jgi:hypothetical protein